MEKLIRDIRLFYRLNYHEISQTGAGKRMYTINYNGHKLQYNCSPNTFGDVDAIIYSGGRDAGRRPCFQMKIIGEVATLQSLERGDDCFVDRYNNSKDLVHAAFKIAKTKGCTKFELVDNSFISCPGNRFSLANLYFLTHGQTWYESILKIKIEDYSEKQMEEFRKLAHTNAWATIAKYLMGEGVNLDFCNLEDIDINAEGSSMKVLNRIKTIKNAASCEFFSKNLNSIMYASNIPIFRGTTWAYQEII